MHNTMRTFVIFLSICSVICSGQDRKQSDDSPLFRLDDDTVQDATLDFKFPEDQTGEEEIQKVFSGSISTTSRNEDSSTSSTAKFSTIKAITTTKATTTTITTTTITTSISTNTTSILSNAAITTVKNDPDFVVNDYSDYSNSNNDINNLTNYDLSANDSDESVLLKDSDVGDNHTSIYDLLELDSQDSSQKNSTSEKPNGNDTSDHMDSNTNTTDSGQQQQTGDTTDTAENDSPVLMVVIIVVILIILVIITTTVFMIHQKRTSSNKATYNIATVEQATRRPREAHI